MTTWLSQTIIRKSSLRSRSNFKSATPISIYGQMIFRLIHLLTILTLYNRAYFNLFICPVVSSNVRNLNYRSVSSYRFQKVLSYVNRLQGRRLSKKYMLRTFNRLRTPPAAPVSMFLFRYIRSNWHPVATRV